MTVATNTTICPRCQIIHEPCPICKKCYCTGEWPWCPHGFKEGYSRALEPVVVFRSPDGRIRIPGSNSARTPKGYERVELTTLPAIRKFESEYKEKLRSESSDLRAIHEEGFHEFQKRARSELRQAMQHMTPAQRRVAELAMARNDARPSRRAEDFEGGFQVLNYDQANRDPQVDQSTGWRPKWV